MVSIVIDDGFSAAFTSVVPLLDQYHFPGVFAVPVDHAVIARTMQRSTTSWEEWLAITSRGHEIAAHSISHVDLTTLTAAELEEELRLPQILLQASTLVYPGGGFNDAVMRVTKKYYQAARSTTHGFETLPPRNAYELRTFDFTRSNFSVRKANLLALWAVLSNTWLIETYHMIDDHEQDMMHHVSLHDFRSHLAFLARLPIAVKTIRSVIGEIL